jgi:hypothetical protein
LGVTTFVDGRYREIVINSGGPGDKRTAHETIFGSAVVPVLGRMVRAPAGSPVGALQLADGGLRHTTPVTSYFSRAETQARLTPSRAACRSPEPTRGCIAADDAMRAQFGLIDMADRCAARFAGVAGKHVTTEDRLEPDACRRVTGASRALVLESPREAG